MKAVIQAGGKGTRLQPYTLILPKPLMPVGELPVIELLLKWLRRNGISDVVITTGYLGHLIKSLCGSGENWDLQISYCEESEPLGTVGALDLLRDTLDETFLMLNGDLITDINLRSFMHFHKSHGDLLTVGTTQKLVQVDMGVIEAKGGEEQLITDFREKPTLSYTVNMGIYCMEPGILELIPRGVPFGFDDLMYQMLDNDQRVHAYRHDGQWLDIGRPEDFSRAQEMWDDETLSMRGT